MYCSLRGVCNSILLWVAVALAMFLPFLAIAQAEPSFDDSFLDMSLDQLGDVQVTSAAKKAQSIGEIAASVYVLTNDEIKRSGVTNIADALRLVPGVQVAKLDANKWAVSIRGFNDIFSNKILILMDGRSVYSPFFGGALWDAVDTVLEDIDRIEVVKGPGGTLWGANAVNGIVNIITKSAEETQGGHLSVLAGNEETGTLNLRFGGELGQNTHYRVFAKGFEKDHAENGSDDWRMGRLGFRMDSQINDGHRMSIQGNLYSGNSGERAVVGFSAPIPPIAEFDSTTDVMGGHIKIDWNYVSSDDQSFDLQIYYDRTEREHFYISDFRDTVDIDFQHRLKAFWQQEIVWGLGFRYITDETEPGTVMRLNPAARDDEVFSAFIQDEISLLENELIFTVGSKFEHNSYTGFEYQPSARLLWKPYDNHSFWTSVSRAVRVPTRIEHDSTIRRAMFPGGVALDIVGASDFGAEELLAYEMGYRMSQSNFSFDLSLFYNDFQHLRTIENGTLIPGSPSIIPAMVMNELEGEVYGIELSSIWQVTDNWRLIAGYSFVDIQLHLEPSSVDTTEEGDEGDTPHHQASLRSLWQVTEDFQFDGVLRYVDKVRENKLGRKPGVPAYITMDLRLAWQANQALNLAVVGQNLFGKHREFRGSSVEIQATDVETSLYFMATVEY